MPNQIFREDEGLLAIGRLGSPFGVEGFLRLDSYSGEVGHFYALSNVWLVKGARRVAARIVEAKSMSGRLLLLLAGCHGLEEARLWTGWEIWVPRSQACPLHPGEFYIADLVGCALSFGGARVGSVLSVLEGGGAPLLEIRLDAGRTVLVPFRKEFIGTVDLKGRTMELLEEWILE